MATEWIRIRYELLDPDLVWQLAPEERAGLEQQAVGLISTFFEVANTTSWVAPAGGFLIGANADTPLHVAEQSEVIDFFNDLLGEVNAGQGSQGPQVILSVADDAKLVRRCSYDPRTGKHEDCYDVVLQIHEGQSSPADWIITFDVDGEDVDVIFVITAEFEVQLSSGA